MKAPLNTDRHNGGIGVLTLTLTLALTLTLTLTLTLVGTMVASVEVASGVKPLCVGKPSADLAAVVTKLYGLVRCAFFGGNLHSRMPLSFTPLL
jgi:hypothetical protein